MADFTIRFHGVFQLIPNHLLQIIFRSFHNNNAHNLFSTLIHLFYQFNTFITIALSKNIII